MCVITKNIIKSCFIRKAAVKNFTCRFALLICLIVLMSVTDSLTQEKLKFKHLSINDGLSQNAVFAILQDSRGFMWFGTKDGLNRYDGYSFNVFYNNPFDSSSLSANYITSLFEDSRGLIWIGTIDAGIDIYSYEERIFKHINFNSLTGTTTKYAVTSIVETADSTIWIGTDGGGLLKLSNLDKNLSSYSYQYFSFIPGNTHSISSNNIISMLVDSNDTLWIGTPDMLDKYEAGSNRFIHFKINSRHSKASFDLLGNGITSIYETKKGELWLGTLSGLVLFERETGSYKLFPHHYNINRFGWGRILDIKEDNSGVLWIATPGELMSFNPSNNSYNYYKNDPFDLASLSYNMVSSIWVDRTGIFWFGTSGGGLNIYDPKASRFSTFIRPNDLTSRISGFSVRTILEDNSGNIWLSTDVLYRWNRKTNTLKSYEINSDSINVLGNTGAWSIVQSSSGDIWFASSQGLFRYNPADEKSVLYRHSSDNKLGLPQKSVYTVFEDKEGSIWLVTANYLSKLIDIEKGIFRNILFVNNPANTDRVRSVLYEDNKQRLWIGTIDGLLRLDKQTGKFRMYRNIPSLSTSLNNNIIKSICPDPFEPDSILWLGTAGGGLNRFNMETNTFTHFTETEGLPNNVVYGILPDEKGNLWLSTNKGISRFNIRTKTFRNYDVNDGLQSNEFNTGAYFKSNSGEMFFGGIKGLNYFYPRNILDNRFVPEIAITGFKLFKRSQSSKQKLNLFRKEIAELKSIELSYDDNFFQIEFAALDYSAPGKNQYAYKLENFNDEWIYSGIERTATYTNLSPGEYIFRVKGSNNDGIWNEKGASIRLIITPPWWSTWWSYFLYGFLSLGVLYLIRRYELNRVRLKNQLKLEKVQSNTLRQVDQMKSRFFTNISHEFRTPLTLILGQIDSLQSSVTNHKDRGKLQVAHKNAQRVLRLINQLLDLSKLEVGSMKLKTQKQNLVSFIKSLFYSFESFAEKKQITLSLDAEAGTIFVDVDPEKMEKVFYNLLSNAFKFTPEGGKISLIISVKEDEFAEIRIKDSGVGIKEERLPHIFNRFYQADDSHTREQEGSGIGLALAKELTELHKGKIYVESMEGKGTEFIILIPLSKDKAGISTGSNENILTGDKRKEIDALIDSDISVEVENSETEFSNQNDKTQIVLVVEDNADVRGYICEQLDDKYQIAQAANGMDGFTQAQKLIPDLIITDVMMPKMDGFEFCKEVRRNEKTSHIPIIMLTAKAGLDDKIEGLETGIDAYLTKPFSAKELIVRVSNLIHQREQLRKRFSTKTVIKPSDVTAASVDQTFLEKVLITVESHIEDEEFNVERLAGKVFMSVSQLNRKLRALIDQSAGQLIRSMRLNRAADLLKQNAGSVAEICYMVGFNDQSYFTRSFKKQFGTTPSEFKKSSKPD